MTRLDREPAPQPAYSFANPPLHSYRSATRREQPTYTFPMARPHRRRAVSFVSRAYSSDPLERIETIGGVNPDHTHWKMSQAAAIAAIEAGTDEFYVKVSEVPVKLVVL